MSKRTLCIDWVALTGAKKQKRKLELKADETGIYSCPVKSCLHIGFKSKRGLRKHIDIKHEWYYYFDVQPSFRREEAKQRIPSQLKASTHKKLSFSIEKGAGLDFVRWLQTPCGGGKRLKEATQIGKRGMKFLMSSLGENEDGVGAQESYIDCCVGSPAMLMRFLKLIMEEWGLKSAASLAYMQAITDLCDFRKCHGVADPTLRQFAVTEVYLRRSRSTLQRRKNLEYSRNLDLESLIARDSWASLEDIEKVIPYHSPKYRYVVKKAKSSKDQPNVSELAFATRFIITFLFLRVKCTRPMSVQFLTTQMMELAKSNDGFVDQTQFKTSDVYLFDSLKFADSSIDVIDSYINVIRPLCKPKCDYVLLTNNGTQYTAIGSAMSLLVHQAIGKYINPTRYRQIVESASAGRLTRKQQEVISKDQKHSNSIAKRSYQKQLSREVAEAGAECMRELVGNERDSHTSELAEDLRNLSSVDIDKVNDDAQVTAPEIAVDSDNESERDIVEVKDDTDTTQVITDIMSEILQIRDIDEAESTMVNNETSDSRLVTVDDIEVKKEELEDKKGFFRFTSTEDMFLRAGFERHAKSKSKWADILKDPEFKFHPSRTRDTLRMRAGTLKIGKTGRPKKKK